MKNKWTVAATTTSAAFLLFGAAALAQSPASSAAASASAPAATGTVTVTGTVETTPSAVVTGTAVRTETAVPTSPVGTTATAVPTIEVAPSIYVAGGQGNFPFANPAFRDTWSRTDAPVAQGKVSRTWFWGPGPNTPGLLEQYKEAPNGSGQRLVQYFDKSRMELNNPQANPAQPFFVTNGLLSVELISGYIQVGNANFDKFRPACIAMSGDFGDANAPTYFAFQGVSNTQAGDHFSTNRTGQKVTQTIDHNGKVGDDTSKANVPGVNLVHYEPQTRHNIPAAFWDFLNSSGPIQNANGTVSNGQLITPWFYASGLPISEAYWAKAKISGVLRDVMIQAYERRVLTYVPTNQPGWQVEMGNIGQHYFDWRYRNFGICPGTPAGTPTPPVPAPTGSVTPGTGTPQVTGTPVRTGTVVPTGTAVPTGSPSPSGTETGVPQPIPVTPTSTP